MSPLACRTCGEPVITAPNTTRLGYSHQGGSEHEVDLIEADLVKARENDVVIEEWTPERLLARGRQAATNSGLPPATIQEGP